ncbi:hypothetical protein AMJ57_04525 [Parcubacteria bacterium SG8_24]|nr:MAG: hypothetical protein AMJ57_04525 [Parcubacteria bacterium SG8_24]
MRVIFDLDYTLLDTARFKEALAGAFAACGVDRGIFDDCYRQAIAEERGGYDYDPDRHIACAAPALTCPTGRLRSLIDGVVDRTGDFLFPETRPALGRLRTAGAALILLTFGQEAWQRRKIEAAGLTGLFDEIHTVSRSKAEFMGHLDRTGGPTHVINDNPDEISEMRRIAPWVSYILVQGPRPVPAELSVPVVGSVGAAVDLVLTPPTG